MKFTYDEIKNQFVSAKEIVVKEFSSADNNKFLKKPGIKRWSASECIEHLNNACKMYLPEIEKALLKSEPTNENIVKISWLQKKMMDFLEPPYRIKMLTGGEFIPQSGLEKDEVIDKFINYQNDFLLMIDKYSDKDFTSHKFSSPAANIFKLTPGYAFLFNAAHQRRHIWQAAQTLKLF